jgi:thiol-disulfide isomerase/thioredoxin
MKKKIVIGILLAFVSGLVWAGTMLEDRKPSEYNIGITYDEALKADKPALVLFYADWCGYCRKFMPKFRVINSLYKDKFEFVMLNVDEKPVEKLAQDYSVGGFPTVYIIDPKYDNRVLLPNGIYMDLKKFRAELDRFLRIRAMLRTP